MFPPAVEVLLKQAAVLAAYLRSAHMGSVLLLAAALLLPFAQAGQFLAGVTRSARASVGITAERPAPAVLRGVETTPGAGQTKDSWHRSPTTLLGLPARLASSGGLAELNGDSVAPEETLAALVRRDLERGPPFFL